MPPPGAPRAGGSGYSLQSLARVPGLATPAARPKAGAQLVPGGRGASLRGLAGLARAPNRAPRMPVPAPGDSTWEEELWRLRRLYEDAGDFAAEDKDVWSRIRLRHHCSDPAWEAEAWAPGGLLCELRVPPGYPEELEELPTLGLPTGEGLPERFRALVPLLFAESVASAKPRTPAVYRALRHVDRHLAALWLKVQEGAAPSAAASRAAPSSSSTTPSGAPPGAAAAAGRGASSAFGAAAGTAGAGEGVMVLEEYWKDDGDRLEEAPSPRAAEPRPQAAAPAAPGAGPSAEEVRRLGSEVRLLGLSLEGFSVLLPAELLLEVVCLRCRKPTELASEGTGTAARTSVAPCPTCRQEISLRLAPAICHGGCSAIAHALGESCQPVQLLRSDVTATCAGCAAEVRVRNVGPGYKRRSTCTGCFAKQNLVVEGAELIGPGIQHWRQVAAEEGERQTSRKQLQEARRSEREMGIQAGRPLPENGECRHFKKSHRWMRFPCCGKAFACGECHDEREDHPHEWANRMLCGFCSHEQPFSNDRCLKCGAASTRARSAFWEGGEGCRNPATMSRKDPAQGREGPG